ncbi:MAG TPA: TolC family protein, partial [Burkholderiaceae bacterium]
MRTEFRHPALLACLLLAGCATVQAPAIDAVSAMTHARTGHAIQQLPPGEPAPAITQLPTADSAVQAAFANHRALQSALAELDIAAADLAQASRPRNPGFSFGKLRDGEIERAVTFDLFGLLTLPLRREIERGRVDHTAARTALAAVTLATQAKLAWYDAVAAAQTVQYMEQAASAAQAAAELSERMARAGNASKLDQLREQSFYAETMAQLERAKLAKVAAREALNRALGLAEDSGYA